MHTVPAGRRGCGHRAGTSLESHSSAGWPKCSHAQTMWDKVKGQQRSIVETLVEITILLCLTNIKICLKLQPQ